MSAVSACPKCHRHVSLPATDDHSVFVRCPHCQAQYTLQAALDYVPPALEIVPASAPALAGAAHAGLDEFELEGLPGEHAGMGAAASEHAAEHPAGEPGFPDGVNGEHAVAELAAADHPPGEGGELGEHEFRFADEHEPAGAFGEGADGEHAAGADDHGLAGADHGLGSIATLVKSAPPRRVKKPPRLVVRLIGLAMFFGSGLLGMIIVYGASLFFLKYDPVPFVGQFYPSFINRAGQTANKGPAKNPAAKSPADKDARDKAAQAAAGPKLPNPHNFAPLPDGSATPAAPPKPVTTVDATGGNVPKPDGSLERSEDPFKTPPADPSKTDPTKIDPLVVEPPKINLPGAPGGPPVPDLTPKSPDKPANPGVTEPAKPADKPPVKVAAAVGPKSPATVELADLETAADAARKSREALDATAAGDPDAAKHARVDYYKAMSHLGTLLAGKIDVGTDSIARARVDALADELLTGPAVATLAADRDAFGVLAGKWVASPARKEAGVLLIGKFVSTEPAGRVFASRVLLFGTQTVVVMATGADPTSGETVKVGQSVIVLGALVDKPAENLAGYEGDATQVVWCAKVEPCPAATAPK